MKSGIYIAIFVAGGMSAALLLWFSPGVTVDDEIGHYLLARHAWQSPTLLLDLWGRPLNTLLFLLPARGGLLCARGFALLLSAGAVLLTTAVARQYGVQRRELIPLFLWFQPWFLMFSSEAVTEVPFLFLFILAVFFSLKGYHKWAGIVWGMLPLVRHEGLLLTGLWVLYMWWQGHGRAATMALLPTIGFNLAYLAVYGVPAILIFFDPKPTDFYGSGNWWHYLPRLAYYAGVPVTLFTLFSLPAWKKSAATIFYPALYLAYFIAHSVIFRFGLYASGGYSIFLFPLAPMLSVAAALGWERIRGKMATLATTNPAGGNTKKWMQFSPEMVIILGVLVNAALIARPKPLDHEAAAMQKAVGWLQQRELLQENIIAANVWFYYFSQTPCRPGQDWRNQYALPEIPPGTLVVWDRHYANRRGLNFGQMQRTPQRWKSLASFGDSTVVIFRRR